MKPNSKKEIFVFHDSEEGDPSSDVLWCDDLIYNRKNAWKYYREDVVKNLISQDKKVKAIRLALKRLKKIKRQECNEGEVVDARMKLQMLIEKL